MENTIGLCIGNWVYDGDRTQFPMFIRAIGEDYVYLDFEGNEGDLWESKPEDLQGIPLTKELLLKLGAKQVLEKEFYFVLENSERESLYLELMMLGKGFTPTCDMYYDIGKPILYLHELQNIYWNLGKKQLNIKL